MKIILFGVSKVSEVIYSYLKNDPSVEICGFCIDQRYLNVKEKFGLPVVSFEEVEKTFSPDKYKMLVTIGYHQMNSVRAEKCNCAEQKGYELTSYVHPQADVSSDTLIGKNCIILNNVSVEPFAEIGNNVSIHCNSTIAHHSKIGNNVWVTSGTVIGGNSEIGDNTFLGINATIGHNLKIGKKNFIGANSVVTKNSDDNSVFIVPDTPKYRLDTDRFMKLFNFD